jgi:hypothetical protein
MPSIIRIAEVATLAAGAAAVAAAGQVLLMHRFRTWEAELIAVLMRELPRL